MNRLTGIKAALELWNLEIPGTLGTIVTVVFPDRRRLASEMLCGAVTMNQDFQILLLVTGDPQLAEEWELVLLAQGLSPCLRRTADGFALSVPREELAAALAALAAYERENPRQPAERVEDVAPARWLVGASVGLTLLIFYCVTVQWLPALSWSVRGSADLMI